MAATLAEKTRIDMSYKESNRLFRSFKAVIFAFKKAYPYVKLAFMEKGHLKALDHDVWLYLIADNDNEVC